MANTLRIKRRASGGAAGAPASLVNAELAYNEQDNTLYYGFGTGGAGGSATSARSRSRTACWCGCARPAACAPSRTPTCWNARRRARGASWRR